MKNEPIFYSFAVRMRNVVLQPIHRKPEKTLPISVIGMEKCRKRPFFWKGPHIAMIFLNGQRNTGDVDAKLSQLEQG